MPELTPAEVADRLPQTDIPMEEVTPPPDLRALPAPKRGGRQPQIPKTSSLERLLPGAESIIIRKRNPVQPGNPNSGKLYWVGEFKDPDLKGETSLESFVAKYIVPIHSHGEYTIDFKNAAGNIASRGEVNIAAPATTAVSGSSTADVERLLKLMQDRADAQEAKLKANQTPGMDPVVAMMIESQRSTTALMIELFKSQKHESFPLNNLPLPVETPHESMADVLKVFSEAMKPAPAPATSPVVEVMDKLLPFLPLVGGWFKDVMGSRKDEQLTRLEEKLEAMKDKRGLKEVLVELKDLREIAPSLLGGPQGNLSGAEIMLNLAEQLPNIANSIADATVKVRQSHAIHPQTAATPAEAAQASRKKHKRLQLPAEAKVPLEALNSASTDDSILAALQELLNTLIQQEEWAETFQEVLTAIQKGDTTGPMNFAVSFVKSLVKGKSISEEQGAKIVALLPTKFKDLLESLSD